MSETHVTVKIPKDLIEEMDKLIGKHGFRSRGEIAKEALRQLISFYEKENVILPRFEQINSDEDGVKIHDRSLHEVVEVYIKRKGIQCSYDQTDQCEHVTFALTQPEVKAQIRKHRKEGWKLPEV
jgi:Arc/MetJ-type ribon-helix-helix transcriptional regulator